MVKPNIYQGAAHIFKHEGAKPPFVLAVCPYCSTKNVVNYQQRLIECPCKGGVFHAKKEAK